MEEELYCSDRTSVDPPKRVARHSSSQLPQPPRKDSRKSPSGAALSAIPSPAGPTKSAPILPAIQAAAAKSSEMSVAEGAPKKQQNGDCTTSDAARTSKKHAGIGVHRSSSNPPSPLTRLLMPDLRRSSSPPYALKRLQMPHLRRNSSLPSPLRRLLLPV